MAMNDNAHLKFLLRHILTFANTLTRYKLKKHLLYQGKLIYANRIQQQEIHAWH